MDNFEYDLDYIDTQDIVAALPNSEFIAIVDNGHETFAWHIDLLENKLKRTVFTLRQAARDRWSYDMDCCISTADTVLCMEETF